MFQIFLVLSVLMSFSASAKASDSKFDLELAKTRCLKDYTQSNELFMDQFRWGYTMLEMADVFAETYQSGKRLGLHANYQVSDDSFYLYLKRTKGVKPVKITPYFIESVTLHIETALQEGFSDFVFFPDMGHSHLYFPEKLWQKEYSNLDVSGEAQAKLYEKMLADKEMRVLYHLTEQLQMLDENKNVIQEAPLPFKYWNRNYVGYNNSSTNYFIEVAPKNKSYNTVSSIEGYKSWSAGFAVSASKDGCFPYRDKDGNTRFFDISLHDPRYDPNAQQAGI